MFFGPAETFCRLLDLLREHVDAVQFQCCLYMDSAQFYWQIMRMFGNGLDLCIKA